MTLTYSEWTQAAEAPPPQAVFGLRPAHDLRHLQRSPRDRFLSAAVSGGGQLLVAGFVIFASMSAIAPRPETQTITVSISAEEPVQPVEPPREIERARIETPTMAAPEILIQMPPGNSAPTFVAAPPPLAPSPAEKVAEPPPVTPPRFDAAYLNNPSPNYPNMSRRLREVGTVQLRVRVSAAGEPLEVQMSKSSGYPRLDDSALSAVKKWKFQPAMRGNTAQEAWVLVPIEFSLT